MGDEAEEQSSPPVVIYFGGYKGSDKIAWYSVDINSEAKCHSHSSKRKKRLRRFIWNKILIRSPPMYRSVSVKKQLRLNLLPAFVLKHASSGCSIILDGNLYWFGLKKFPSSDTSGSRFSYSMLLAKHNLKGGRWKRVYSCPYISDYLPAMFSINRELIILCGADTELNLCGGIYHLDDKTWKDLSPNIDIYTPEIYLASSYFAPHVVLTEDKTFMFYSLKKGSVLKVELSTGVVSVDYSHGDLALWGRFHSSDNRPRGLEGGADILDLIDSTHGGPARLSDNILYWFTSALRMYGYDINHKRWFRSQFLGDQFPSLSPGGPLSPSLVILPNGKFSLVIYEDGGNITVAPLAVSREEDSLSVTVESLHHLSIDKASFFLLECMSTVKG